MPFWSLAPAEVRSFAWACHTPSPIAHLLRSQLQALKFSFFRLTYYSERLNSSAAATLPHPKLISKNLGKFQGFANMKLSCRSRQKSLGLWIGVEMCKNEIDLSGRVSRWGVVRWSGSIPIDDERQKNWPAESLGFLLALPDHIPV